MPDGTLWAKTNIGATTETEVGDYFAWGETTPKTSFTWANYKFGVYDSSNAPDFGMSKYNSEDGYESLKAGDDAASVLWGSDWRMPTREEVKKLLDNTTQSRVTNYNGSGITGYLFTGIGDYKNVSIFLPNAGYKDETGLNYSSYVSTWTSDLDKEDPRYAYFRMKGSMMDVDMQGDRYCGVPIRPVRAN